jgi:hypothetical protein
LCSTYNSVLCFFATLVAHRDFIRQIINVCSQENAGYDCERKEGDGTKINYMLQFTPHKNVIRRIPLAAWYKAYIFGRTLALTAGSNPVGGVDVSVL